MIACTVVAVLAAIATPSYRQHVIKTHRVQAQTCMMSQANVLERHYTHHLTYDGAPTAACASELRGYHLQHTVALARYTIEATLEGTQGDPQCGRLTLDQAGRTTSEGTGCW